MKILITDRQRGLILKESKDNLKGLFSHWEKQLSKGKQIRFDRDELEYWGINTVNSRGIAQMEFRKLVRNKEGYIDKVMSPLIGKEFSTEDFDKELIGGYDFKWIINEFVTPEFLYGDILPGGSVALGDGRTLSLSEAMDDEDIGWEIKNEMFLLVKDCMNSIVVPIIGQRITTLMELPEE